MLDDSLQPACLSLPVHDPGVLWQMAEAEARAAELRAAAARERAAAEAEAAELREQTRRAQEVATRAELAATQHVRAPLTAQLLLHSLP